MIRSIGVSQRVEHIKSNGERRDCLDQRWCKLLAELGCVAVPIPNNASYFREFAVTTRLSGFILSGGNDLVDYGGNAPERDALEREVLAYAESQNFPVLGICRGMQLMHVADGGGLVASSGHVRTVHSVVLEGDKVEVNSYHSWTVQKESLNYQAIGISDDNSIEAIRHRCNPQVGLMWHPERQVSLLSYDRKIFESLFQ